MRSSSRLLPAILESCLALLISSRLAAQQPQAPTPSPSPKIESYVSEVLVPVVVRDAQGHAVGTLKKEDFQVFDNGKPQVITGFTMESRSGETAGTTPPGRKDTPATPQPQSPPQRYVVLFFDDLNLSNPDLMQAQEAAAKILDGSLLSSDNAAIISTSGTDSGLTRDHATLQKALLSLKINPRYQTDPHDCPHVDYYQGDLIANKQDSAALEVATTDALACANLDSSMTSVAAQMARQAAQRAVDTGDQDLRVTLGFLRSIVHNMSVLPGQRALILVSSGFLASNPEALMLKSNLLDTAAQSNVTISAIDARGLYTTGPDLSEKNSRGAFGDRMRDQYRNSSMSSMGDVMAELADGTGGTFFHNSNDLAAGFDRLLSGPGYLYLLAFSPANVKPDGKYHDLKVKVNQQGLQLQARHGYVAPQPQKNKK
jgi:VWFA-related protein